MKHSPGIDKRSGLWFFKAVISADDSDDMFVVQRRGGAAIDRWTIRATTLQLHGFAGLQAGRVALGVNRSERHLTVGQTIDLGSQQFVSFRLASCDLVFGDDVRHRYRGVGTALKDQLRNGVLCRDLGRFRGVRVAATFLANLEMLKLFTSAATKSPPSLGKRLIIDTKLLLDSMFFPNSCSPIPAGLITPIPVIFTLLFFTTC